MRFHFIRHGKRDHTIGDPSLTSEGRQEAELLAKELASNGIARIFSSPLARTRETAEIIATILNLEVWSYPASVAYLGLVFQACD